MKRKILAGLASLTLLDIAAGHAADVARPVYKSQPVAVVAGPSWTGWYLGGHLGYRWTEADLVAPTYSSLIAPGNTVTIPGFNKGFGLDGFIGGVHLGYNWQFDRNWLIGLEGDISWGREKDSVASTGGGISVPDSDAFTFRRNSELTLQWQASIRARAGYVVDTWLWYVTGGIAFEKAKWSDSISVSCPACIPAAFPSTSFSTSKTLTGWVIGAGVEQMFSPNWIWRVEYLYENFGDFDVPYGLRGVSTTIDMDHVHKLRVGLSYKFGDPGKGPVVAKY